MEQEKEESSQQAGEKQFQECKNCGREIPKGTRFCRECGTAQKWDSFPLLILGCLAAISAVYLTWRWASPYTLIVSMAAPMITLVIFALILSFILWR